MNGVALEPNGEDNVCDVLVRRRVGSRSAQRQLLNWLFALHGGGLIGMSLFAESNRVSLSVKIALWSFAVGLISLIAWGLRMVWFEVGRFRRSVRDAADLQSGLINEHEFRRREQVLMLRSGASTFLGWVSGVCSIAGLVEAAVSVLSLHA